MHVYTGNGSVRGDDTISVNGDLYGGTYGDALWYPDPWNYYHPSISQSGIYGDVGHAAGNAQVTGHDVITLNGHMHAGVWSEEWHGYPPLGIIISADTYRSGAVIFGDAASAYDNAQITGNDTITVHGDMHGEYTSYTQYYGDVWHEWYYWDAWDANYYDSAVYGDVRFLTDNASSRGDDNIVVGTLRGGTVYGDAAFVSMNAHSQGNDSITVNGDVYSEHNATYHYDYNNTPALTLTTRAGRVYGDSATVWNDARVSGDDTIVINGYIYSHEAAYALLMDTTVYNTMGSAVFGDVGAAHDNATVTGHDDITVTGNIIGSVYFDDTYDPHDPYNPYYDQWSPVFESIHSSAVYGDAGMAYDDTTIVGNDTITVHGNLFNTLDNRYEITHNDTWNPVYESVLGGAVYGDVNTAQGNAHITGHDTITVNGDIYALMDVTLIADETDPSADWNPVFDRIHGGAVFGDARRITDNATVEGSDHITVVGDIGNVFADGAAPTSAAWNPVAESIVGGAVYGDAEMIDGEATVSGHDTIFINGDVYADYGESGSPALGGLWDPMFHSIRGGEVYGDAAHITGGARVVGNDTITVNGNIYSIHPDTDDPWFYELWGGTLFGDAATVDGAATVRGDDTITVNGNVHSSAIYGDAIWVGDGATMEGHDTIVVTGNMEQSAIHADADPLYHGENVISSNDTVTIRGNMHNSAIFTDSGFVYDDSQRGGQDGVYIEGLMANGHIQTGAGDDIIVIGSALDGGDMTQRGMTTGFIDAGTGKDHITIYAADYIHEPDPEFDPYYPSYASQGIEIDASALEEGDIIDLYDLVEGTQTHVYISNLHSAPSAGSVRIEGDDVSAGIGESMAAGETTFFYNDFVIHFR